MLDDLRRVFRHLVGQEFQRSITMQSRVFGLANNFHRAAQLRKDAIVTKDLAIEGTVTCSAMVATSKQLPSFPP